MTDKTLEQLASLQGDQDYTDPDVWRAILTDAHATEAAAPVTEATQGETATPATEEPAAPAAATVAEPPADSSAAPAAAEKTTDEPVDGVLTRDGKRVIPYDVLAEARRTALANADRAKQLEETQRVLQEQIEALKQGKAAAEAQPAPEVFSKERIDAVRDDMPEMAELMESQNRLARELAEAKSAAAAVPAPKPDPNVQASVQAAIDDRPLLAKWQAKGGLAWHRAVELDKSMRSDPAWANKPMAEQFADVERAVADELGIDVPAPSATPAAPAPPVTKPAPAAVKVAEPPKPSVSDFNGAAPITSADPLGGLAPGQQVDKAMAMSIEDIYRLAGVQH